MGGDFSKFPKCPVPFESAGNLSCVMPCRTDKGFERRNENGTFKCVYKTDPSNAITLNTLGAQFFDGTTLDNLKAANPTVHLDFTKEQDRVKNDFEVLYANIDKQQKLKDAFLALQAAENARDTAPEAYQAARTLYYTLLKGDDWKNEEKDRIAKAEIQPLVDQYARSRETALLQYNNQRKTVEVVTGIKDKVLSLKDEFKYSVNTFTDQLDKVKNAINMERRGRETETKVDPWSWFDLLLNLAIVVGLLYAVYVLYSKIFRAPVSTTLLVQQPVR
jgi:predicted transposase YbfD/YdcC